VKRPVAALSVGLVEIGIPSSGSQPGCSSNLGFTGKVKKEQDRSKAMAREAVA